MVAIQIQSVPLLLIWQKTQHFGACHTSTTITIHTIYCNLLLNLDNTHFNRSRCYTANLTKHNIFAVTLAYLCFSWCTSSKSCQLNTILDHIIATGPLIFNWQLGFFVIGFSQPRHAQAPLAIQLDVEQQHYNLEKWMKPDIRNWQNCQHTPFLTFWASCSP